MFFLNILKFFFFFFLLYVYIIYHRQYLIPPWLLLLQLKKQNKDKAANTIAEHNEKFLFHAMQCSTS